ncbi:photoactive yellow protein [Salipiger marinus]|uniref:Photoactive yellow protein n=1 Tax=Salipiger marinus TaxID=555512 RepID=A0A1G8SPJ6_9RHOB|nr:photoactive yellow protein [Salipiger marinus]
MPSGGGHTIKAEGLIANRVPDQVVGMDFFNQIAPCAKGKRFHGEFIKFHRTGQVNVMFDYKFGYKGTDANVKIHMKSQPDGQSCWLFVKRV